jgi:DNA uptake protein ComE-like DNA-binding protein
MQRLNLRLVILFLMAIGCIACSRKPTPDELKQKTAEATATLKSDAKAVAQGVREGWSRDHPLDLNTATNDQLLSLPGITAAQADRIIADRPYTDPHQLVSKRILSQTEYDKIADRLTAKPTN